MNTPVWLERTELLIGSEQIEKLKHAKVLVVGLGGVGSFAAEFLARAGIGKMVIVDGDTVDITNTNRQLPAMHSTVGMSKALLMEERLRNINPEMDLIAENRFIDPGDAAVLLQEQKFDYVLDCIDSITPKIKLIMAAKEHGANIISSMGAGGKRDTMQLKYADISKTRVCPFAYYVRKRLRKEGISEGVMTVYSEEPPVRESVKLTNGLNFKKSYYGTISYIPALFGLHMSAWVVRRVCGMEDEKKVSRIKK